MKKIIKLTESDLLKLVKRVIKEQNQSQQFQKTKEFYQNVKLDKTYGTIDNQIIVILYSNDSVEFVPSNGPSDRIRVEPTITIKSKSPISEDMEAELFKIISNSITNGNSVKIDKNSNPIIGQYKEISNFDISVKYKILTPAGIYFTSKKGNQIKSDISI
jgi:hypothetical protein